MSGWVQGVSGVWFFISFHFMVYGVFRMFSAVGGPLFLRFLIFER